VCSGTQLLKVITELEAGTYPQPDDAIWRDDLPRDLAVRLALATGATAEQIAEITSQPAAGATIAGTAADGSLAVVAETRHTDITEPAADPPDIIIRHTHEDGTLVLGTSKNDGVYELIGPKTAARFRYFPSIKMIGIPQSRDHLAKRWQIDMARKALEAAGFTVAVEIDDTPRDVAQAKADRAGRLDDRYDRLTAAADRNQQEGDARWARATEIVDARNGQPRLAGHHSTRRWDADAKRIDQNEQGAKTAYRKAARAATAASVVGDADAYRELPPVIIRRIDKNEAELRQTMHYINGTRPANDWRGAYSMDREPATGDWLEQLTARKTFIEHQLEADRAALAEHEKNGYVRLTRETVHKGDTVTWAGGWGGNSATVTRVNPKTVTLNRDRYPRTLPYEQIRTVECPHADLDGSPETVTVTRPRRQRRRDRVEVSEQARAVIGQQVRLEEPLTVAASTECFQTPPAVVAEMISAAALEPHMTVLEPSAGLGAIALAVAPLVAAVDCIENESQLVGRLLAAWNPEKGAVEYADFLEIQPNPIRMYDRVLMNPPFSRQADIKHVLHALGFLRPGGLLVAVMSAGVEFRQDKTATAFRELVAARGGRIERLDDDAFAGAGISVRTVLAIIPASTETEQEEAA
jgi:predicted RNA methylase